jgi:tape measure domain-containing protein
MFDLGAVFVTFKAKTDEFVSGLNQVKSSLGTAATNVANIGMKVVKFGAAAATAFYGAATAAGFFAVKSAGDFQQARIAFETMLGSAEKAGKLLQQVSDFAAKTPFELPQVVEGAKKLLAYNIEAEKIIPTFNSLGNIAAGVGKDKLPQLIMAFGQVKAATRLTGMELRQFTEAGVPLLDILAKQMGKTTAEMVEMISDGKVGFPEVEKAIFGMSAEGGKFFNLMERQSKTFDGVMSNLRDNIGRVARNVIGLTDTGEVVKGGFFDKLSTAASNLLMWFDKNRESIIAFLQNGLNVLLSVGQQVINVVTTLYGWVKTLIDGFRLCCCHFSNDLGLDQAGSRYDQRSADRSLGTDEIGRPADLAATPGIGRCLRRDSLWRHHGLYFPTRIFD